MSIEDARELVESLVIAPECQIIKTIDLKGTLIMALDELEQYRAIGTVKEIKHYFKENRMAGYKHGYSDGYAKAIDNFAEKLCDAISGQYANVEVNGIKFDVLTVDGITEIAWDLAEQMKGE